MICFLFSSFLSLDKERVKLVNVNDSQCKIVVSSPNSKEDEGIWYFMIIQKRNIYAQWYLHRVVVTFLDGKRYSANGAAINSINNNCFRLTLYKVN